MKGVTAMKQHMSSIDRELVRNVRIEERKRNGTYRWKTETERLNDRARNLGLPGVVKWDKPRNGMKGGFWYHRDGYRIFLDRQAGSADRELDVLHEKGEEYFRSCTDFMEQEVEPDVTIEDLQEENTRLKARIAALEAELQNVLHDLLDQ